MKARSGEYPRGGGRFVRGMDRLLVACYGDRTWSPRFFSLLDGLVHTILSQNTSDVNSGRAFHALKERFPSWEEAASAPVSEMERAIRSGGISRVKAERIRAILGILRERSGSYSLEFLRDMEADEALAYLLDLPGVGRKTAAVLLLFQLGYPLFPVDTHILRVGKRLGLFPAGVSAERAHDIMDAAVPDDIKFRLHLNMISHGRRVCRARKPDCPACCLRKMCPRIGVAPLETWADAYGGTRVSLGGRGGNRASSGRGGLSGKGE